MVQTITQYKTAVFKIHNPSQRKKAILHHALYHAHIAYDHILKKYLPNETQISVFAQLKKGERSKEIRNMGNAIDKYIRNRFPHLGSASKYGIQVDCTAQISSYVAVVPNDWTVNRVN